MGEKRGKTAHLGRPQQQMNQSGDLFLGVHWSKQVRRKGRFRGLESDLGLGLEGGVGRCSPGVTYFSFLSCDTGSESYSFGIRHRERLTCRLFPIRNLRWWAGEKRERAGGATGCGHCGATGSSSDGMTACGYDGHFGGSPSHEDVFFVVIWGRVGVLSFVFGGHDERLCNVNGLLPHQNERSRVSCTVTSEAVRTIRPMQYSAGESKGLNAGIVKARGRNVSPLRRWSAMRPGCGQGTANAPREKETEFEAPFL